MIKYHKIQTVYKREKLDNNKYSEHIIEGNWTKPEFEYLSKNKWEWYEKIDGTNIRIEWNGEKITFNGRTDKARIPENLYKFLNNHFISQIETFKELFGTNPIDVVLFGEGYGYKIQKVGSKYIPDSTSFIGFDININNIWLKKSDAKNIFKRLHTNFVPLIYEGSILEAIEIVKKGFKSKIALSELQAEGLVGIPIINLTERNGNRIITKLKTRDFTTKISKGDIIEIIDNKKIYPKYTYFFEKFDFINKQYNDIENLNTLLNKWVVFNIVKHRDSNDILVAVRNLENSDKEILINIKGIKFLKKWEFNDSIQFGKLYRQTNEDYKIIEFGTCVIPISIVNYIGMKFILLKNERNLVDYFDFIDYFKLEN